MRLGARGQRLCDREIELEPAILVETLVPALAVAVTLMLVARPVAVFISLAPFRFPWREKIFISWVGLRGAVAIFLASIPLLVNLPKGHVYFDVAFVIVIASLLISAVTWTGDNLLGLKKK